MWSRRAAIGVLGAALLLGVLGSAGVAAAQPVDIEIMVSRISDEPGAIDRRADKLHAKLQREFRYQSLRVLQTRKLKLAVNELGTLELPNGRTLRVKPLDVGEDGALLAVDVKDVVQTDLRVRNGHLVVIGAGRHQGGKLVISFEPRW